MKGNSLWTADIHLTDRPEDEYRWELFPWLEGFCRRKKIEHVFLLGDLTDEKDHHSAKLVNRIIDALVSLAAYADVYLLKGNHDYVEKTQPFFGFLRRLGHPKIHYFKKTAALDLSSGDRVLFCPHSLEASEAWIRAGKKEGGPYDLIACHGTFRGCRVENGTKMQAGIHASMFHSSGLATEDTLVIAGDIHVPQRVGKVTYCGAPYPIRFGDDFTPRVLYTVDGELRSWDRSTIRKVVVETDDPSDLPDGLSEGDQLRLLVRLPRRDFPDWPRVSARLRRIAQDRSILLRSIELRDRDPIALETLPDGSPKPGPTDVRLLRQFCRSTGVPRTVRKVGLSLIRKYS
jgi:predicted phosphodiesterase